MPNKNIVTVLGLIYSQSKCAKHIIHKNVRNTWSQYLKWAL